MQFVSIKSNAHLSPCISDNLTLHSAKDCVLHYRKSADHKKAPFQKFKQYLVMLDLKYLRLPYAMLTDVNSFPITSIHVDLHDKFRDTLYTEYRLLVWLHESCSNISCCIIVKSVGAKTHVKSLIL